jgi:hypothetical protein
MTTFTISISPFTYNPTMGDLLLDVVASNTSGVGNLQSSNPFPGGSERLYLSGGSGTLTVRDHQGLVTDFLTGPAPVPAPLSALVCPVSSPLSSAA